LSNCPKLSDNPRIKTVEYTVDSQTKSCGLFKIKVSAPKPSLLAGGGKPSSRNVVALDIYNLRILHRSLKRSGF
jgi:hypothetical protein